RRMRSIKTGRGRRPTLGPIRQKRARMVAVMDNAVASLLLAGIPLLGAAFGFAVWSRPDYLRNWSVVLSVLSLAAAAGMSGSLATSPENLVLVYLLPVAACASLLGQPVHKNLRLSW